MIPFPTPPRGRLLRVQTESAWERIRAKIEAQEQGEDRAASRG